MAAVPDKPNAIARINMRELRELAEIMVASGAFSDIKQLAQAQVKILAGQEFGFSPIVSMTGIHFFQGKVEFSATLKASVIKSSGKYDYEITEHSPTACEAQFYRIDSGQRIKLGVPVRYTIDDAKNAGLAGKGPWKEHPMDMLFAAVIRQGMRRHCAELLHGTASDVDVELNEPEETAALAGAGVETVTTEAGDVVDTATGEVIDGGAGEPPAFQSAGQSAAGQTVAGADTTDDEIREWIRSLAKIKFGDDRDEYIKFLNGRNPKTMDRDSLIKLHGELAAL